METEEKIGSKILWTLVRQKREMNTPSKGITGSIILTFISIALKAHVQLTGEFILNYRLNNKTVMM